MPDKAYIQGAMLKWARERAYLDVDVAARAAGVSAEKYALWEGGHTLPTMRQARLLAEKFHRSVSLFYLEEPPDETEPVAELRRTPGRQAAPPSAELAWQIRLAVERREFAIGLAEDLGDSPNTVFPPLTIQDDIPHAAARIRGWLGVSLDEQLNTSSPNVALNLWRDAFERCGVLVFQVPGVETSEMHGFAIATRPLPIVAYNSDTSDTRRIFTMLHELVHLLLNDSVIHTVNVLLASEDSATEFFCNKVAAEVLVPAASLSQQALVLHRGKEGHWSEEDVKRVARDYMVSPSVLVRRLNHLGWISEEYFAPLVRIFDSRTPTVDNKGDESGGNPYANRKVHISKLISRLALQGYYQDVLSLHDLSRLFNLRPELIGNMEHAVYGRNVMFG